MHIYKLKKNILKNLQTSEKKSFLNSLGLESTKSDIEIEVRNKQYKVNTQKPETSKVGAISIFSGGGGLDLGAHLAGVNILSTMDHEKDCMETIASNSVFHDAEHICASIENRKGLDYRIILKSKNPEKLILIGGPPCQPFSKAGYWVTHKRRLGSADPRNMISHYLRLIKELKPNGFLLENVESLLHPKNRDAVALIEDAIDALGYKFILYCADARDFGVPQRRKRVFFIASKKTIDALPKPTHEAPTDNQSKVIKPHERVIDWVWNYDIDAYFEPEEVTSGKTYAYELSEVPPGQNYFALTSRNGYPNPKFAANKRFWNFLLKLHPLQPSWTLAALPGPWVGPLHWNNRRLRIPELAAIQTFPSDYRFSGTRRSIQKQIGNAVPPLLGKAMVEFLIQKI